MKKILLLILFSTPTAAFCLELRLQCTVTSITRLTSGQVEREKGKVTVEVSDFEVPKFRSIIIDTALSNGINSVTAGQTVNNKPNRISTSDFSDKNKWDISTSERPDDPSIKRIDRRIVIDRSTGELLSTYTGQFASGNYHENSVSGPCEKIDTTKKKF